MIYFDNAATTLQKPKSVAQAVYEGIASAQFGNPGRGSHRTALNALTELYKTRVALASFFNLDNPLNIALTQNASASLNFVINSLFEKGDHIITSDAEHNSVLRPLYALEQKDVELSFVKLNCNSNEVHSEHTTVSNFPATIQLDTIEQLIQPNTKAVVITHASNVTGNKTDLTVVHNICQKHNLIMIVDASQTVGCIAIDISKFSNSIFCFTGHKGLFGPAGTGGIAINGKFNFKQVFAGGSGMHSFEHTHPNSFPDIFEVGTANVPSFIGLRAGIEFIQNEGVDRIENHLRALRQHFVKRVCELQGVTIYGELDSPKSSGSVGINLAGKSSAEVSGLLDENYDIATRPGAHCAPRLHEALGTVEQGIVRFSFSYFNTIAEIDKAVECLKLV